MPNYQNGKIYKITSQQTDDVYYGSTTMILKDRWKAHKSRWKLKLKYDGAKIELVELFPCSCKYELEAREGYYIKNNKCVNQRIPTRTDKEYREDTKDKIKIQQQKYIDNNKDKISEYQKKWYLKNKKRMIEVRYWKRHSPIGILARSYF